MSQQPVQHDGAWWTVDGEGLIHRYNEQTETWEPWDPESESRLPPPEWAQGGAPPPPSFAASTPPNQLQSQQPIYIQSKTNGLAIASMVLGILWLWWLGSILALVFGYIAKGQIDRSQGRETGRGMAVAGIVLGWIGVAVIAFVVIALVADRRVPL